LLLVTRNQNGRTLEIHGVNQFIEVHIDGIVIGRVKTKRQCWTPDSKCDECLVLPNHVIVLDDAEVLEINVYLVGRVQ